MDYSLKRATLANILGYGYLIIVSFISTPLLLRGLGVTGFASYALIIAAVNLLSSLDLGLGLATIRYLSSSKLAGDKNHYWHASKLAYYCLSLTIFLLTWIFSTLPISLLAGLTSLIGLYSVLPQALGKFGWYNLRTLIVGTANTLGAGYLAISGFGIDQILILQSVATLVVIIIFSSFQKSVTVGSKPSILELKKSLRVLLTYGLKNQVGTLVGQAQNQFGKFVLATIAPVAVASFSIAKGVVMGVAGGVVQVATALFPKTAGEDLAITRKRYHMLQLSLVVVGVLSILLYYFFGLSLLTLWLGSSETMYIVHDIFRVLVVYFAILVLTPLASMVLNSRGYPGIVSFFAGLTFAIELALTLVLLPSSGYMAPVWAGLIGVLITTPALLIRVERVLQSKS